MMIIEDVTRFVPGSESCSRGQNEKTAVVRDRSRERLHEKESQMTISRAAGATVLLRDSRAPVSMVVGYTQT